MTDQWAKSTLRITSPSLTPEQIEDKIGVKSTGVPEDSFWFYDLELPSDQDLNDQLQVMTGFLEERLNSLQELSRESEINLSISWTPRFGQDGVQFTERLINILGSLNAYVMLDTYIEEE